MQQIIAFIVSILFSVSTWAATLPVTYAVRNSVGEVIMYAPTTTYTKTLTVASPELPFVSNSTEITTVGVVADKLQRLGYRPDDPRVGATIDAIQKEAVSTAVGAAGSGFVSAALTVLTGAALGTPIGWGAIGVAALVGVAGYGLQRLVTGGLDWLFNSNGTVTPPADSSGTGLVVGGPYWNVSTAYGAGSGTSYGLTGLAAMQAAFSRTTKPVRCTTINATAVTCEFGSGYYADGSIAWSTYPSPGYHSSGSPVASSTGLYSDASVSAPAATPTPVSAANLFSPSSTSFPDSERVKPVDTGVLAKTIDALWRSAADRDSSILSPQTISSSDVSGFLNQNPSIVPRGDNLTSTPSPFSPTSSPSSSPSGSAVPTSPDATTNPGPSGLVGPGIPPAVPVVPTAATPKVDLGPDPKIGAPSLETIPTGAQILAPLLGLFPDLRSYVVPSHTAECPKPSMDIFSRHYVMDAHCTVLEAVRPVLYLIMAAVWVMIAALIVLGA